MRLLVVHNPTAGDGTVDGEIERIIGEHGHTATLVGTSDDWEQAIDVTDPELVVVAGGDGTVRKVLTALAGTTRRVALLPLGTANNVARSLGLAVEDPFTEVALWCDDAQRRLVQFDIATVDHGDAHRFVESYGGGFVAAALASADDSPQWVDDGNEHGRRHLVDVLERAVAAPWTLEVDGVDRSGEYLAVEVMNVATVGPILPLAPSARPDDGRFDVVTITEADRDRLRSSIRDGWNASAPTCLGGTSAVSLTVGPPRGVALHLDDELFESDGAAHLVTIGDLTVGLLAS